VWVLKSCNIYFLFFHVSFHTIYIYKSNRMTSIKNSLQKQSFPTSIGIFFVLLKARTILGQLQLFLAAKHNELFWHLGVKFYLLLGKPFWEFKVTFITNYFSYVELNNHQTKIHRHSLLSKIISASREKF